MSIELQVIVGILMSLGFTFAFAMLAGLLGWLVSQATDYEKP